MRILDCLLLWLTGEAPDISIAKGRAAVPGAGTSEPAPICRTAFACGDTNTSWVNQFYPEAYDTTRGLDRDDQACGGFFFHLVDKRRRKRQRLLLDRAEQVLNGRTGTAEEANDLATQVLQKSPGDVRALHIRARAYYSNGFYDEAYRDIDRAVELTGSRDGYLIGFRGKINRHLGKTPALRDINQALGILHAHADAFADRGDLRLLAGDYQGGLEDHMRVLELRPADEFALDELTWAKNQVKCRID